jgi:hypothetical protein
VEIDIKLTRYNREILHKLCLNLFPYFNYVRVKKSGVVFKRNWYSLSKKSSPVAELVLLELPNALNLYYQENEFSPKFPTMVNMYQAIDQIAPRLNGGDVIQYLQYVYNDIAYSVKLRDEYNPEPVSFEVEEIEVETSKMIKQLVAESIDHFTEKAFVINEIYRTQLKVVYFNSNLSCMSPPIRAPGDLRLTA